MIAANDKKIVLKEIDKFFIVWFFISWLHSVLGFSFYLSLIVYLVKCGVEGGIKSLVFATTRSILSVAVAAKPVLEIVKLAVLLGISIWILMQKVPKNEKGRKYQKISVGLLVFDCVVFFSAFIVCSYPITSLFKALSFSLCFLAVLKGIAITADKINWSNFLLFLYGLLFGISFILIPFSQFRIVNQNFQGVFNHVNLFGIMGAFFVAVLLKAPYLDSHKGYRIFFVIATLVMIYLSASRTGMFSSVAVILGYILFNKEKDSKFKDMMIIFIIFALVAIMFVPALQEGISKFIYKGNDEFGASRSESMANAMERFKSSPLLGTGFMVPYKTGAVSWALDFNTIVEPCNLLWMLLADVGIVGFIMFIMLLFVILKEGAKEELFLLLAPLMICMGEMVFFSPNNLSILLYVLMAVYLFEGKEVY